MVLWPRVSDRVAEAARESELTMTLETINGDKVEVWGRQENGRVLVLSGGAAYVGYVGDDGLARGLRWECSEGHLNSFREVYASRFPIS